MTSTLHRLRYTVRKLARTPVFSVVAVITLALAIGANTAVFSVVNGVLLQPLPFEDPGSLVGIWHTAPGLKFDQLNQSPALHVIYREQGRAFEDVGMWDGTQVSVTGLGEPEQLPAMQVTAAIFPILGVTPAAGRLFSEQDDSAGAPETIVLSHEYWQRSFGGDPGAVGRVLTVNGRPREIIGVTGAGLQFLDADPAMYLPFQWDRSKLFVGNFSYQALGRLKPGMSIAQANADVDRMVPLAIEEFPGGLSLQNLREARFAAAVHELKQDVVGDVGSTLWVLLGTVALVLLIACANVANLFLVRAEGRQQEMAVRSALGASRARLARELLAESVCLAGAGGLAGVALAWFGLRALVRAAPRGLPRLDEIGLDPVVLSYALALTLLAGVAFGLVPVLRYRGAALAGALKEGGRGGSAGRERHRARNALVVAQVALALVLLVGSGLMIRSFQALRAVKPGFVDPAEVLTLRLTIPAAEIEDVEEMARTHELIRERLAAIPGVDSVAVSVSLPMDGWDSNDALYIEEFPMPEGQLPPIRRFKWIGGGYLDTLGNTLLAGRPITWDDVHDRAKVAVITENMAREYWGEPAGALGKRVRLFDIDPVDGSPPVPSEWREIVGVVGNVYDEGVDQEPPSIVYWPMVVRNFWGEEIFAQRSMAYAIRTGRLQDPGLLDEVRTTIWAVNPNLPLANVRTQQEILDGSMARTSFTLVMLAIAAGMALVLGSVGIYGVTSYVVSQRTREIGVRMALGAQRGDVSRLVLRQGLLQTALGLLIGAGTAGALSRLMASILFGVSPADPLTYGSVAVMLATVALLASYLPARRAAMLDPVVALRLD